MSLPMSHRIGPASAADLPEVEALLRAHHLPVEGLEPFLDTMLISRSRGRVIGCAALEVHGDAVLLRSVAVDPGWQGRGLGEELVERITSLARSLGSREVFLLTTTAAGYFARLGFVRCTRDDVPGPMRQSLQFTTLCPESAVVMRKAVPELPPAIRTPRKGQTSG